MCINMCYLLIGLLPYYIALAWCVLGSLSPRLFQAWWILLKLNKLNFIITEIPNAANIIQYYELNIHKKLKFIKQLTLFNTRLNFSYGY